MKQKFPTGWYPVLKPAELPSGKPVRLERFGLWLVAWRDTSGKVVLMEDRCPHRGASLALGKVVNGRIACPFHGLEFDPQGRCQHVPEVGKPAPGMCVRVFPSQEQHDFIWMHWGNGAPAAEVPWFSWLPAGARRSGVSEEWDAPLAHVIENQIDYAHIPIVHADTIGRGISPTAPVKFELRPDSMKAWFTEGEGEKNFAEYLWPGVWGTKVSEKFSLTIGLAPVREGKTRLYLEAHRGFATAPLVAPLVDAGLRRFHRKVLSQDRPMVLSQVELEPQAQQEDMLLKSDQGIRWFREKLRAAMGAG
jgi:phenylpropionate dioxygenase-like ring-hydroxylating dioxygenase large terminal subunit